MGTIIFSTLIAVLKPGTLIKISTLLCGAYIIMKFFFVRGEQVGKGQQVGEAKTIIGAKLLMHKTATNENPDATIDTRIHAEHGKRGALLDLWASTVAKVDDQRPGEEVEQVYIAFKNDE